MFRSTARHLPNPLTRLENIRLINELGPCKHSQSKTSSIQRFRRSMRKLLHHGIDFTALKVGQAIFRDNDRHVPCRMNFPREDGRPAGLAVSGRNESLHLLHHCR